jgi:8-oxo-dGTP pyrophosphatase MutT (NUDIX family)
MKPVPGESYRDGVNVILEDAQGRTALQLRDDLPGVSFGGLWGLFGGWVEAGEEPLQTAIREIREELSITLVESRLTFVGVYLMHGIHARDFVFHYPVTDGLANAHLTEGQTFQFMSRAELGRVPMVPHHLELLAWAWALPDRC